MPASPPHPFLLVHSDIWRVTSLLQLKAKELVSREQVHKWQESLERHKGDVARLIFPFPTPKQEE
jgi:hypothetical protein